MAPARPLDALRRPDYDPRMSPASPAPLAVFERLEARVAELMASHDGLVRRLDAQERELGRLRDDLARYGRERVEVKARLDALLAQVDAAVAAVEG
jgi:hypothetical protein